MVSVELLRIVPVPEVGTSLCWNSNSKALQGWRVFAAAHQAAREPQGGRPHQLERDPRQAPEGIKGIGHQKGERSQDQASVRTLCGRYTLDWTRAPLRRRRAEYICG